MRADLEDFLIRSKIKIVHTTRDMTPYFEELTKTFLSCVVAVGFAAGSMILLGSLAGLINSAEVHFHQRENYSCDKN